MGQSTAPRLRDLPMDMRAFADKAEYEAILAAQQKRILEIQLGYFTGRRRAIIVFEGWDAAGKGGAIRRLTAPLDPRGVRVWPIGPPSAEDRGHPYLRRFWERLPPPGGLAVFDRSWYGRVLVERVEKLAPEADWRRAYDEINGFERLLHDDGIRIVKLFLHITPEEQADCFRQRLKQPLKQWKITMDDLRARERWDAYVEAAEEMFARTSTAAAPWHPVPANSKWVARTTCLRIIADALSAGLAIEPPPLDPEVRKAAARMGLI